MAKFCPECANPIVDSNMPFCPKCGAKLPITSPEVHPPATEPVSVQQPAHPSWDVTPVNSGTSNVQTPASQPQGLSIETSTKKRSLSEWYIIIGGGIILLIFLSVFIAGSGLFRDNYKYCSDNYPGTIYDPALKTCEKIVTQTPYPTPEPTVVPTQDPIIGVWIFHLGSYGIDDTTYEIKYKINADGTYLEGGYANSQNFMTHYGTWVAQGNNLYLLHNMDTRKDQRMKYDPVNKTVHYAD